MLIRALAKLCLLVIICCESHLELNASSETCFSCFQDPHNNVCTVQALDNSSCRPVSKEITTVEHLYCISEVQTTCLDQPGRYNFSLDFVWRLELDGCSSIDLVQIKALKSLKGLRIMQGDVKVIHPRSFPSTLLALRLCNNPIEAVDQDAFSDALKLRKLTLESNRLAHLPRGVFSHLQALEIINLSENELEGIEGVVNHLLCLHTVLLSRNKMERITNETFFNCSNLSLIDLSYNPIKAIDTTAFIANSKLETIHLTGNSHPINLKLAFGFTSWLNLFATKTYPSRLCIYLTSCVIESIKLQGLDGIPLLFLAMNSAVFSNPSFKLHLPTCSQVRIDASESTYDTPTLEKLLQIPKLTGLVAQSLSQLGEINSFKVLSSTLRFIVGRREVAFTLDLLRFFQAFPQLEMFAIDGTSVKSCHRMIGDETETRHYNSTFTWRNRTIVCCEYFDPMLLDHL